MRLDISQTMRCTPYLILGAILAFGLLIGQPAHACSCPPTSLAKSYREAEWVFVGTVVSLVQTPRGSTTAQGATVTVDEVLGTKKGPDLPAEPLKPLGCRL